MNGDAVLEVSNLSVAFGQTSVVRDVSFGVARRKTLAIVGESGSGKSVTSLAIMRLLGLGGGRIVGGQIAFRSRSEEVVDLVRAPESQLRSLRGADMAMIFQEPMTALNPVFKVGDQVMEAVRLHLPGDRTATLARALRMLDLVRIPDSKQVMGRYPHQLSGGMRQRIMIAMALVCEPNLLIADEPTTALDVTVQAQILQIIRGLQDDLNMGVVFITHDMGVVAEIADEVMVMRHGETVEHAPVREIFSSARHPYTRRLLSAVPKLGAMTGTDRPSKFQLVEGDEGAAPIPPAVVLPQARKVVLLQVKNLVARYDLRGGLLGRVQRRVHAVEDVSFDIYPGETLALVGESGCGKSTTARAVACLLKTQGGKIEFDGKTVGSLSGQDLKAFRREVQMVFQDPYASLDPRRTIEASILEPFKVHGLARGAQARLRAAELLTLVGLDPDHATRFPHQFSGGQRQRICIARALALSPKLIVADESVSALDVSIQAQIINLMQDLQRDLGIAFLFISHDLAVVERVSHRVAVMYLGRVVEIGSRRQIFETPRHAYTRRLLSAVPIADPRQPKARRMLEGEVPSPIHDLQYVPEDVRLDEVAPGHFVALPMLFAA